MILISETTVAAEADGASLPVIADGRRLSTRLPGGAACAVERHARPPVLHAFI